MSKEAVTQQLQLLQKRIRRTPTASDGKGADGPSLRQRHAGQKRRSRSLKWKAAMRRKRKSSGGSVPVEALNLLEAAEAREQEEAQEAAERREGALATLDRVTRSREHFVEEVRRKVGSRWCRRGVRVVPEKGKGVRKRCRVSLDSFLAELDAEEAAAEASGRMQGVQLPPGMAMPPQHLDEKALMDLIG